VLLLSLQLVLCSVDVEFTVTKSGSNFDVAQFVGDLLAGGQVSEGSLKVKSAADVLCVDGNCFEARVEQPPSAPASTGAITSGLISTSAPLPVTSLPTSVQLPTTALNATTGVPSTSSTPFATNSSAMSSVSSVSSVSTETSTATSPETSAEVHTTHTTPGIVVTPPPVTEPQGEVNVGLVVGLCVCVCVVIAAVSVAACASKRAPDAPKSRQAPPPKPMANPNRNPNPNPRANSKPVPKVLQIKIDWPHRIPNLATKTDLLDMEAYRGWA
jgi:hypothetical protein